MRNASWGWLITNHDWRAWTHWWLALEGRDRWYQIGYGKGRGVWSNGLTFDKHLSRSILVLYLTSQSSQKIEGEVHRMGMRKRRGLKRAAPWQEILPSRPNLEPMS
jgi:hypothetical protein